MHLQENKFFDLWVKVMKSFPVLSTSCDLSPAKFEVDTSNSLGGGAFTGNLIISPWPLGFRSHKCHLVPSTSYYLYIRSTKFEATMSKSLEDTITRHVADGGQNMDRIRYEIIIP